MHKFKKAEIYPSASNEGFCPSNASLKVLIPNLENDILPTILKDKGETWIALAYFCLTKQKYKKNRSGNSNLSSPFHFLFFLNDIY